jgi:hypothetical protein
LAFCCTCPFCRSSASLAIISVVASSAACIALRAELPRL